MKQCLLYCIVLNLISESVRFLLFVIYCMSNLLFFFFFLQVPLRKNHHLIVVERFACPNEPGICAVWCLVLLEGFPMANWSPGRGLTKNGSRRPKEDDEGLLVRSEGI